MGLNEICGEVHVGNMNCKECESKGFWPNLRYYLYIFVEGPRKAMKNVNLSVRILSSE
jgi:hypothetical protein